MCILSYPCALKTATAATLGLPDGKGSANIPIVWLESRKRWQLTTHSNGKRTRSFYSEKAEAEKQWRAHCRRAKRFGTVADQYSPEEHWEFVEAKRIVPEVDLRDVASFYRHHHPEGAEMKTVSEAAEEFIAEKKTRKLSKRHFDALSKHVERFALTHGERQIRSITRNEVAEWLKAIPHDARTVSNHRVSLTNFFNWCRRWKLVQESPTEEINEMDLPTITPKPTGVLAVDQVAAMMEYLDLHEPKYAPWHALQIFAGIRRAEVGRMEWEWIDLKARTITLPGWTEDGQRIVKTGDDWVLHGLPKNLWKWLSKHRGEGRIAVPGNDTAERLRKDVFPKLKPSIPTWPQNALRHTFCTMMMSFYGDAAKVANWSRHTNAKQLYKSYVAKLVSKADAKRFLGIEPHPVKAPPSASPPASRKA